MNTLDQIIRSIHEKKYYYMARYGLTQVDMVVLISHEDYRRVRNDVRTYLCEKKSTDTNKEINISGCLVLRTSDLAEGDIRYLVETEL